MLFKLAHLYDDIIDIIDADDDGILEPEEFSTLCGGSKGFKRLLLAQGKYAQAERGAEEAEAKKKLLPVGTLRSNNLADQSDDTHAGPGQPERTPISILKSSGEHAPASQTLTRLSCSRSRTSHPTVCVTRSGFSASCAGAWLCQADAGPEGSLRGASLWPK